MNQLSKVQAGPIYQRHEPVRDEKYLKFIRSIGVCVGCGRNRRTEAMHTGSHGLGQKASDLDTLPGCRDCHRELHRLGPVAFQDRYKASFTDLILMFQSFYQTKLCRKCPKPVCSESCKVKGKEAA